MEERIQLGESHPSRSSFRLAAKGCSETIRRIKKTNPKYQISVHVCTCICYAQPESWKAILLCYTSIYKRRIEKQQQKKDWGKQKKKIEK
jgi:hypothetical protein